MQSSEIRFGKSRPCPRVSVIDDFSRNDGIEQHRQTSISKSKYHVKLEETSDPETAQTDNGDEYSFQDIRYWSDFSRVFYSPRSIQPVPDPVYGELECGDWGGGPGLFSRYNEVNSITSFYIYH
jgi:hypothetical protein